MAKKGDEAVTIKGERMIGLEYSIDCPSCGIKIHIPFVRALEAKALEDYDMAETSAQDKLFYLRLWLHDASLITLLKYWVKKELDKV